MKYLSVEKLKITKAEREYLILTKNILKDLKPKRTKTVNGFNLAFDMGSEWHDYESRKKVKGKNLCNTAGCIFGWMGALSASSKKNKLQVPKPVFDRDGLSYFHPDWDYSLALERLFYPNINYGRVTPKIASKAIEQFLSGKDHIDWL